MKWLQTEMNLEQPDQGKAESFELRQTRSLDALRAAIVDVFVTSEGSPQYLMRLWTRAAQLSSAERATEMLTQSLFSWMTTDTARIVPTKRSLTRRLAR